MQYCLFSSLMRPIVVAIAALALLPGAQAIYIQTPLQLSSDAPQTNVGVTVNFTIGPDTDDAQAWAGKSVRVEYAFPGEGEDYIVRPITDLTLDADVKGAFSWTIPSEVDNKNVDVRVMSGEDLLAVTNVGVGESAPIMYATGGGPADSGQPLTNEEGQETTNDEPARNAPGIALVGGLLAVAFVALAMRRK